MNTLKKNLKFTVLLLVSLMIILGVSVLGYAEIASVSDRTPQVRDAIVAAVPGVNSTDEVTETHLAAITNLNLRSTGIAELKSGDFSGMIGLTSLNLYNNQLSSLPDGIFEGLTALTSIRLGGNTVDPMPISVSLEKIEDGQFKAVVPIGAPFDIVVPISASNGSIADSATSLTIAKGSTGSSAVTVSRTANTTVAVTANIGTLPGLPRNHYGYVLTKSDALPLEVISEVTSTTPVVPDPVEPDPVVPEPVEPDPVVPDPVVPEPETPTNTAPVFTDGSTAIRSIAENTAAGANIGTAVSATDANEDDTLTYTLSGVDAASFDIDSTTGQLKTKRALDYEMKSVYSVTISATDGTLTDTITVIISVIDVDDTPFVSTILAVSDRTVEVRDAIVTAVPGVTDAGNVTDVHLAAITSLNLRSAGITELKSGDFSGMTGLTSLNLYGNILRTLPIGIFEGLTSLNSLRLGGNLADPLPLIVSLQQIDAGEFQAVVHTSAPFEIVLPIGAMMITIPKGSLTSASFTNTSTPSIGTLPALPANHYGYTLAKSTVYNRTPQVRDAIIAALSDVNDYRNVTEVDLATITSLNLDGKSITSLQAGDFAGMLSLTMLNLNNNQLTSLPVGIFAGLVSLGNLDLSGNTVDPLPMGVSLLKVGENQIKALVTTGAPFDISLPISVENGSIGGTTLTISTGSVESQPLTVTRTSGTTAAVTVDITLPSLSSGHTGYALVKSNQQPLEVFEDINITPVFIEGTSTARNVAENTEAGVNIGGPVIATDSNNDTLTYSLNGTDASSFEIDSETGQLKTLADLDFETKSSYSVTITVSDGSLSDTITVGISVTDVDENRAPVFTEGSSATRTVAENTGSGVDIGTTAPATDADNDTLSYSLGGTDADAFSIDSSSGQLQTKSALDYETKSSYSVIVTVSDGELTNSITVTITVTDIDEDVPVDNVVGTKDDETPNNAPVFTEGSSASREVAENTGSGVNIGSAVSATDADEDTLTYSLGENTDADEFSIDSSSGQLKTSATLDYETKDSYSVTITVSDGKGGSDSIFVTINITNIDESAPNNAPVFSDGASTTRTVAENTGSGVDIGSAVSATDADEDTLIYSLGENTDADEFSIDSSSGQLRTSASLDYETKTSYSVTIIVSDGKGGSDTITVTITVADVDETPANNAPVFSETSPATRSIAENTTSDVNIGSAVSATDADNDTLAYGLTGTDASVFSIDNSNGQLQTSNSLDYETKSSYSVTVTVSDVNGGSDSIVVTINVTDVNEAPVFSDGTTTRTIAENVGANINIGTAVKATDPDTDDSLTYTLGGTDAASFAIDDKTGQLKTKSALDYATKTSYTVTVSVSDGSLENEITVTINVKDLDETPSNTPPVFTEGDDATRTIAENTAADTNIGTPIAAIDADSKTLAYVLSGTDASLFSIDDETGQLKTSGALNYETKDSYTVTVTVSDGSQNDTITVTINVTNANDAPVFAATNDTVLTIAENTAAGTNIGTAFAATDEDNDALTFSLGGEDAASFDIGSGSGQLKTKDALDYESNKNAYSVTVTASDGTLSDTISVTITVTDVDENSAPVFTEGETTTREVLENTGSGLDIGEEVEATDADINDTLEYTLGGTDADLFGIGSTDGQLRTKSALDYEDETSYSVTITASDGKKSDSIDVTINVTDVDENRAPAFATESTTRSVDENTAADENIGTPVEATDADTNDTLTYTLGGDDADAFDIDTGSGQLKTKAALDYEGSKNAYSVTVTASDGTLSDTITVTINVTDVDENRAPAFATESTTRSVDENTAADENIGNAIAATDPDNDTLMYSLSGTDAGSFDIDTGSGQLKTKAALDHETQSSYTVTVAVSDGNNGNDSITVAITVSDVNEAPVFAAESTTRSVDENTAADENIGSVIAATDPDDDTLIYSLGGTNAAAFDIDTGSGQLKTEAPLDYEGSENVYSVTVTASDGTLSDTITVEITVSDVNENSAPTFANTGFSYSISVIGNVLVGAHIGDPITATDTDNDTLTYTVVDNDDDGVDDGSFFSIDSSGQLKVTQAFIDDSVTTYSIKVIADDGNGGTAEIAGTVIASGRISTQVTNNTPVFTDSNPTTRSIVENTTSGQNIDTPVGATDADTGDILTYTLDGTDAASFDIVSTSGQLQTDAALDYETKTSYTVTVTVTDDSGVVSNNSATITVTINITDVDEGTSITSVSDRTQQVQDAIVAAIPGVSSAADVTAAHLADITSLNLNYKSISSLSDGDFSGLNGLTDLKLAGNGFSSLPTDIFDELSSLTSLNLAWNMFTTLPDGLFDGLTALKNLDLVFNELTSLPVGIFNELTALEILNLGANEFTTLSDGLFDGLTALKTLNIYDSDNETTNQLTSLPTGIFDELTSLEEIDLDGNKLSALPAGVFDKNTSLKTILMTGNLLASLPDGVFDENKELKSIILVGNKLTSLPDNVFDNNTKLTSISIGSNDINSLAAGIFDELTELTIMYIEGNKLTSLPDDVFGNNTKLESLDISGNEIGSLQGDLFSNLTKLTNLYISSNKLSSLPDGLLVGLTKLTSFECGNNEVDGVEIDNIPITVTLVKVADGQFKAVCPVGVPRNIQPVPVVVANGAFDPDEIKVIYDSGELGFRDMLIGIGKSDSGIVSDGVVDVVRTAGTTGAVTVDIESIRYFPNLYNRGYEFVKDTDSLPLEVIPAVNGAPSNTPQTPDKTALLANYPNPFNPETWIPYHLAKPADVTLTIYDMRGIVVRELKLGQKPAGFYQSRNRAIHWDGKNKHGERVANGVYFYQLQAGNMSYLRKMVILK